MRMMIMRGIGSGDVLGNEGTTLFGAGNVYVAERGENDDVDRRLFGL
jgi:hypothetical protein